MKSKTWIYTSWMLVIPMYNAAANEQPLTFSGYLDVSYHNSSDNGDSSSELGLDTFELRLNYQANDKLQIEAHAAGGSDADFALEQAHLKYQLNDNVTLVAGKFLSIQGWEAFHAPDLMQSSTSATLVYPGMMNGISASYSNSDFVVYGAYMASAWDADDTDTKHPAFELAFKLKSIENINIHLGYTEEDMGSFDQSLVNFWLSYVKGPMTLAAEYNQVDNWGAAGHHGAGWLLMANYKFNAQWHLTLRTSSLDVDDHHDLNLQQARKWTISPQYHLSEDWAMVLEYSKLTDDVVGRDRQQLVLESVFSF